MKKVFKNMIASIKEWNAERRESWAARRREEANRQAIRLITVVPGKDGCIAVIVGDDVVAECKSAPEAIQRVDFIRREYVERMTRKESAIWY